MIFFKKEEKLKLPKNYAVIEFSPEARRLCVGGVNNMKILVYQGKILAKAYDFSMKRIEQLEKMGIPVVAREFGKLPFECKKKRPDIYYTFGKLRFS